MKSFQSLHAHPDEAVQAYGEILASSPQDVAALYGLGMVRLTKGQLQDAADHFFQAVSLKPDHAQAACRLGVALWRMRLPEQALANLAYAARLAPRDAEIQYRLGDVLGALGRTDEALAAYDRAPQAGAA